MPRPTWLYAGAALVVLSATLFQVLVRGPALEESGLRRALSPINHEKCKSIPGESIQVPRDLSIRLTEVTQN
jgi:hypothetical protein